MFGHSNDQQQPQQPASTSSDPFQSFGSQSTSPITSTTPTGFTPPDSMPGAPAITQPAADLTTPELPPVGTPDPAPSAPASVSVSSSDDLLTLKQQALQNLSPLVSHLDQTPEEKFRTTMMMIQASDDQSLIKVAFEAAQQITDDKSRAQALLDVINEINYFTQHNGAN